MSLPLALRDVDDYVGGFYDARCLIVHHIFTFIQYNCHSGMLATMLVGCLMLVVGGPVATCLSHITTSRLGLHRHQHHHHHNRNHNVLKSVLLYTLLAWLQLLPRLVLIHTRWFLNCSPLKITKKTSESTQNVSLIVPSKKYKKITKYHDNSYNCSSQKVLGVNLKQIYTEKVKVIELFLMK